MSLRNACTIPTCRQSTWANVQPSFALYMTDSMSVHHLEWPKIVVATSLLSRLISLTAKLVPLPSVRHNVCKPHILQVCIVEDVV